MNPLTDKLLEKIFEALEVRGIKPDMGEKAQLLQLALNNYIEKSVGDSKPSIECWPISHQ